MTSDHTQREVHAILVSGLGALPDRRYDAMVAALRVRLRAHLRTFSKLGSRVDDVVQDALCTITSEKLRQVEDPERFLGWCLRIATNRALEELRRDRCHPTEDDEKLQDVADPGERADESVQERERLDLLRAALAQMMDDPAGVTLYLRMVLCWSYPRIAEFRGISEVNARMHVTRARARLRGHEALYTRFRNLLDD